MIIKFLKREKYIWLSELMDYKKENNHQGGFYLEMELQLKESSVLVGFLDKVFEDFHLFYKNYTVCYDKIVSENEARFNEVYLKTNNYAPMTLFSRNFLGKQELENVRLNWKEEKDILPNAGEIWVTPFNFDYDGHSIIFKEIYLSYIVRYFKQVAKENEARFTIDFFKEKK